MSTKKTIAELRAQSQGTAKRAERLKQICLEPQLLAEIQRLTEERQAAFLEALPTGNSDGEAAPRRLSERPAGMSDDVVRLDAEIAEVYDRMIEASGTIVLRASTPGEWRRWVSTHPPRKDNKIDERLAFGLCDADALANDLAVWVASYNDEPVTPEDLSYVLNTAAPADVNDLIVTVVRMHEEGVAIPKSRSASSASPKRSNDSDSPETSASRTADSTAGSPPSDTSTTTPTEN